MDSGTTGQIASININVLMSWITRIEISGRSDMESTRNQILSMIVVSIPTACRDFTDFSHWKRHLA